MEEIKKAFGIHWNTIEHAHIGNGWISLYKADWGDLNPKVSKMNLQHQGMFWRMDTLRNLPDLVTTLDLI